jgi:hypothetical protein
MGGKRFKLSAKKGKKVSANVSHATKVENAIAQFKTGVSKSDACQNTGISRWFFRMHDALQLSVAHSPADPVSTAT